MSQENVELARGGYRAFTKGDLAFLCRARENGVFTKWL